MLYCRQHGFWVVRGVAPCDMPKLVEPAHRDQLRRCAINPLKELSTYNSRTLTTTPARVARLKLLTGFKKIPLELISTPFIQR